MQEAQLRWRRRKEARPQEILEAALSVFAEKGFAATRKDDIAQRAGVERGVALLSSIIARGIERGEFRRITPEHVVRLCIAPLLFAALWRTTFAQFDPEPYDLAGLVEAHIDVLMHGLAQENDRA